MKRKYDGKIFRLFSAIFELWPIVATIGGRIVVMHGGVPRNPSVTVDMLRDVDTRKQPEDYPRSLQDEMFGDVLGADPHEGRGIVQGQRGGDAAVLRCRGSGDVAAVTWRLRGVGVRARVGRGFEVT